MNSVVSCYPLENLWMKITAMFISGDVYICERKEVTISVAEEERGGRLRNNLEALFSKVCREFI